VLHTSVGFFFFKKKKLHFFSITNCTEENTNLEISFLLFSSVFLATKHIAREVREFLNRNSGTFIIFKFLKCVLACETLVLS
jgi:hypothetical protein